MGHISLSGETLFKILNFPVSNTFLLTVILSAGIFLFFLCFFKKSMFPSKIQNFLEWILEGFYNFIDSITETKKEQGNFPFLLLCLY